MTASQAEPPTSDAMPATTSTVQPIELLQVARWEYLYNVQFSLQKRRRTTFSRQKN